MLVPTLERLQSALRRAKASGRSTSDAQIEICRAIDEGHIAYRLFPCFTDDDLVSGLDPGIASQIREGLRSGKNLAAWRGQLEQLLYPFRGAAVAPGDMPKPLNPRELDWRRSCFNEPWRVPRTSITAPVRCHVRIELLKDEVTRVLLGRRARRPPAKARTAERSLRRPKRGRPAEFNWQGVKARLVHYATEHGPIQSMVELVQKCADFASDLHPKKKTPDDKTIRDAIRKHGLAETARVPGKDPGKSRQSLKSS
jgi:hypothetical protein